MKIPRLKTVAARLAALRPALKVGLERIERERDYADPENLAHLLRDRGFEVLDRDALAHLVAADPGPLYYGDLDLCDNGDAWEQNGGPWADRLESQLIDISAVRRLPDPHADYQAIAREVRKALQGESSDAWYDALASVAEHLGIDWTPANE